MTRITTCSLQKESVSVSHIFSKEANLPPCLGSPLRTSWVRRSHHTACSVPNTGGVCAEFCQDKVFFFYCHRFSLLCICLKHTGHFYFIYRAKTTSNTLRLWRWGGAGDGGGGGKVTVRMKIQTCFIFILNPMSYS